MSRRYELKARAESQEQTRQRIIDAAIALHQEVGPSNTSVTAIADRAGVGRLSVYRHFPDEAALLAACSGCWFERHPMPDPQPWLTTPDPRDRVRAALRDTYAYYRRDQAMIGSTLADVGDQPVMAPYHQHWDTAANRLTAGFGTRGRERRRTRAAIGHALAFTTWHSLTHDQGLNDDEAAGLALRLIP